MFHSLLSKISITLAGMTLIVPIAYTGVSANQARPKNRQVSLTRPIHHGYKFAYNKRQYRLAIQKIKQHHRMYQRTAAWLTKNASKKYDKKIYKRGVFDAYAYYFNKLLMNNKSYQAGYMMGVQDMSGYLITKRGSKAYYYDTARYGTDLPNYVSHIKLLAHNNLLN